MTMMLLNIKTHLNLTRTWRCLNENFSTNSKIDFTKNYEVDGEKGKFKFGGLGTYQTHCNFQIAEISNKKQEST